MNLATADAALIALVATLSGLAPALVTFDDAPRVQSPDGVYATLSWVSRAPVGVDSARYDYAANADPLLEMTPTVEGNRICALQIAVESIAGWSAADVVIERLRDRIRWPSALAALAAVDLAVATVGATTKASYPADGRTVSRSLFELRLNASASETDTAGATSYLADAAVTSHLTNPDGTTSPVQITGSYP